MIEGVLGKLKQLAGFPFNATVIAFFALLFWAFQYLRLGQDSTLSFLAYLAIAALAAVNLGLVHFNLARKTCELKDVAAGSGGLAGGVVTQLPFCCAPLTLEMLGLAAAAGFFAQYGGIVLAVSIALLLFSGKELLEK